jgi:hypothetical protein
MLLDHALHQQLARRGDVGLALGVRSRRASGPARARSATGRFRPARPAAPPACRLDAGVFDHRRPGCLRPAWPRLPSQRCRRCGWCRSRANRSPRSGSCPWPARSRTRAPPFRRRSALPRMISTSFILSTGLKKWMPMNLSGRALARWPAPRWAGWRCWTQRSRRGQHGLGLLRDLGLQLALLEHRLDDQVAALQVGRLVGGRDAGQQRLLVVRAHAALVHARLRELLRCRPCRVRPCPGSRPSAPWCMPRLAWA